jgi:hypothetical protein
MGRILKLETRGFIKGKYCNVSAMGNHINYCNGSYSYFFKKKFRKMKLEIQVREIDKSEEPDWDAMGVRPKNRKSSYKFRRWFIDTYDIEYVKEYDKDLSIMKCTWMEESVMVIGAYDDIVIKVNDLENSYFEEEDEEVS